MQANQLCAANYHYKRYTLAAFLDAAERLATSPSSCGLPGRISIWRTTIVQIWIFWPAAFALTI